MLDVDQIVRTGGLLAVALIIFAETGLLIGFFLPGDTLLIAAGLLASQDKLNIWVLLPVVAIAAIAGYQVGYRIGEAAGPRFFKRKGGLFFREEYIHRTQGFFDKHGGKSILLARFVAIVRTVVPLVAGIGKMDKRKFLIYNISGSILWTFSITLAAYWIGQRFSHLDRYISWMLLAAVVGTVLIVFVQFGSNAKKRHQMRVALREELGYLFKRGQH